MILSDIFLEDIAMTKTKSLTEGPIFIRLFLFTLPIMATGLLQVFYNMADHIVVGGYSGDDLALAAIGSTGALTALIVNMLMGLASGSGVIIAQNYGAKDYGRIKKGVKVGFGVGAIYTAFSMAGMLLLSVPMSRILLPANTIVGDAEKVYELVFTYALFQSSFYYALFVIFQMRQCVQAIDRSLVAMFGGVVEFAMRTFIAFTFAKWFGFVGACLSNPLAFVGGAVYLSIAFVICFKKLVKKESENQITT